MNDKILTIKKSTLVDIANQVRAKTGSTDLIKVADLDDAVAHLSSEVTKTWNDVPVNNILDTPIFYSPNNKMGIYYSYMDKEGLYYKNKNGEVSQIWANGAIWGYFFELSNGCLYVGNEAGDMIFIDNQVCTLVNSAAETGIYLSVSGEGSNGDVFGTMYYDYNEETDSSKTALILFNKDSYAKIYEVEGVEIGSDDIYIDSRGNTYLNVYSNNNEEYNGLFLLDGNNSRSILTNNSISTFFEDSKGNIYCCGTSGIVHINNTNYEVNYLYEGYVFSQCNTFFESKLGDLYLGLDYLNGNDGDYNGEGDHDFAVLYINGSTCSPIINENNGQWTDFFETVSGDVYISNRLYGIYYLNKNTAIKSVDLSNINAYFNVFYETKKGDVYVGNKVGAAGGLQVGLYHIDREIGTKVISDGYLWNKFVESESGDVYVTQDDHYSSPSDGGVYHLDGVAATKVIDQHQYFYFVTDTDGNIYATTYIVPEFNDGSNVIPLYKLNGANEVGHVVYVEV